MCHCCEGNARDKACLVALGAIQEYPFGYSQFCKTGTVLN
jgi:hypothetical protein